MKIRPWAEFDCDFPVDGDEDDDGNITEYPGRAVSNALAEILRGFGCEIEAPRHAHEQGWDFSFKSQGGQLWCQVTFIDRWLLVCEPNPTLFGPSRASRKAQLDILTRLNAALGQDSRFGEIRYFTGDEVHTGFKGALSPLSEQ